MTQSIEFDPVIPVIEAVRAGDRCAFEEFVRQHTRWLRGVAFAILGKQDGVDDVVQQVWTVVWERIKELREARFWRTWLYRLTRNAAIDVSRDEARRRKHLVVVRSAVGDQSVTGPEGATAADERQQIMLDAIQGLPSLYREPFVLRHLNGFSYQQIGEVLELPVDTVETRLVRARRLLREELNGKLG